MATCILCSNDGEARLTNVHFDDGAVALLDVDICGTCHDYLELHGKRVTARTGGGTIIDWSTR